MRNALCCPSPLRTIHTLNRWFWRLPGLSGKRTSPYRFPASERTARLRELEAAVNIALADSANLPEFQERLYRVIEDWLADQLGHQLGRWEYDSQVEYWGGQSYMDPSIPDELVLRSEYPHGVRLNWGVFEFAPWESRDRA